MFSQRWNVERRKRYSTKRRGDLAGCRNRLVCCTLTQPCPSERTLFDWGGGFLGGIGVGKERGQRRRGIGETVPDEEATEVGAAQMRMYTSWFAQLALRWGGRAVLAARDRFQPPPAPR